MTDLSSAIFGDGRAKGQNRRTLFDRMLPHESINLKIGAPGSVILKRSAEAIKKATTHRMDQPGSHDLFQYGPELGDREFLETLGKFLTEEYHSPVDADNLMVTAGATQGLNFIAQNLFAAGDLVFVENPTYFIAIEVLRKVLGLEPVVVPMDEDGIIPEKLEEAIVARLSHKPRELSAHKPYWSMLYLISTLHNPTAACLSPDRCRKVVELARKYNLLIVCDDVYNLLFFPSPDGSIPVCTTRLFAYDDRKDPNYKGNVVSNCSFSKIFGPGMRLGWMEAPPHILSHLTSSGQSMSGGGLNHALSGIMDSVISLGLLKEILIYSRRIYQENSEALCAALRSEIPCASFRQPLGGFFVWINFPENIKGQEILKLCEKEKVSFFSGEVASPNGDFTNCIRLCFSFYNKEDLVVGVKTIGKAVERLLPSNA